MAHPIEHAKLSVIKFGGRIEDYIAIHQWFDETQGWVGESLHRMFRHHSEGIFEAENVFGPTLTNSDGKVVYTRYIAEQHIREDCDGYIPSAKKWLTHVRSGKPATWLIKTMKITSSGKIDI